MDDNYVSMYWLSKRAGVPFTTISRWVKSGRIPSIKVANRPVILRVDALEFLNNRNDELVSQISKLRETFKELGGAVKELYPD